MFIHPPHIQNLQQINTHEHQKHGTLKYTLLNIQQNTDPTHQCNTSKIRKFIFRSHTDNDMKTYTGTMNTGNNQSTATPPSDGMLSNQSSVNSFESAIDSLLTQTESSSSQNESRTTSLLTPRHSVSESLRVVYEQFGSFMKWIRSVQNGESLPYNYQSALEESINMEIKELEFLYKEVRAVVNNVECLKNQRKAIRKEKNSVERLLRKIEYEENQELEKAVMAYDKAMFSKWESVKTSTDLTMVENLLEEAEGKYQAMNNLKQLLHRRKTEITLMPPSSTAIRLRIAESRGGGLGGKPKYTRRLDSILAARESRRKRARTRAGALDSDDVITLPTTNSSAATAGVIAIRDSLEAIDQSEMNADIRVALNTLFGGRANVVRETSNHNAGNKTTTADNDLRSSDIHLVLTPILNDFVPGNDQT